MFVNVSNHPSSKWSEKQLRTAKKYGQVKDLPFPTISKDWNNERLEKVVQEYLNTIVQWNPEVVMVQGEFVFTYRLVSQLKERGFHVVASRSERICQEYMDKNNQVHKNSVFDFICFVDY